LTIMEAMGSVAIENMSPLTGMYTTKDNQSLLFVILQPDRYWQKFCKAVGREDLLQNPKYDTMEGRNADDRILRQAFMEAFMKKTFAEWVPLLEGIPYARRQTVLDAISDVQAKESGCFVEYEHPEAGLIKQLANPIMMSKTPASVRMPAPEFGQHTEEILLEYGYTWDDIAKFQEDGTIAS
jgi:crotonobetainyl-CoA:carnitine CoA-transferase CaiB-like acyl-CoA transferase